MATSIADGLVASWEATKQDLAALLAVDQLDGVPLDEAFDPIGTPTTTVPSRGARVTPTPWRVKSLLA